mgnify:CR=1 FL=1
MLMQKEITMECFTTLPSFGVKIWTHDIECRVTIEPDEDAGDSAYYIAAVEVWGKAPKGRFAYFALREDNLLRAQITEYAYKYHHNDLEDLWAEYLADKPARRRPLTDIQEHGTLRAGAL